MRVTLWVDALEPHLGGIGRYTWELCKGLSQRADIEDLRFLARGRLLDDPSILLTNERLPRRRRAVRWLDSWRLRRRLRTSLVHGPNYFLPDRAETGVITVHDLSVFKYPETHPAKRVQDFERRFLKSLDRASHIITDTETIRTEIADGFGVGPERMTAIPLGVDDRFRPLTDADVGALHDFGLSPGAYGLCVSTVEPRKKIGELLTAWRQLPAAVRARFPLVLAGGYGWNNADLHDAIGKALSEGWLKHLGFVDEAMLPSLYAGAALFLYPSIYEGFGLPPLEAMASGVPVITSGRSCLPEVSGAAARHVDPDDIPSFSRAIEGSLLDEAWRKDAIARGLERAESFTWARCIDATADVYRNVSDLR